MAYRNVSVWLEDIVKAIERIEFYIKDVGSLSNFLNSKVTIDATERNIKIIAEALNRSLKLNPQLPITDARKIIGLRNIINHEYYEVEYDRLYTIIIKNLPVLKSEVKKILEEFERKLDLNEL
jgi:uncharacterized protein with HEPN domain